MSSKEMKFSSTMYLNWCQIVPLYCFLYYRCNSHQQQEFCCQYHRVKSYNDNWLNSDDLYIVRHYSLNIPINFSNIELSTDLCCLLIYTVYL